MMPLTNVETYERTNRLPYVVTVCTKMWQAIYDNFVRLLDNLKHNILYETNNIKKNMELKIQVQHDVPD